MSLADLVAGVIFVALNAYAVLGGADFGGGVWDLLALGPRKARQRELIAEAIGPVWEANHVWLILAIVLLFTCFPPAFARLGTRLHIPLSLVLIGIVLRGSAFTFWRYGADEEQRNWGKVFAIASLMTPLLLGTTAGAIASGAVGDGGWGSGDFSGTYVAPRSEEHTSELQSLTNLSVTSYTTLFRSSSASCCGVPRLLSGGTGRTRSNAIGARCSRSRVS